MYDAPLVGVLGATGFVGGATCDALRSQGADVMPLRSPRFDFDPGVSLAAQVERYARDATLPIERSMGALVNCAGNPDASSQSKDVYGANAILPATMAHVAARLGVPRLVHVSSAVVQGTRGLLSDDPPPARGSTDLVGHRVGAQRSPVRTSNSARIVDSS